MEIKHLANKITGNSLRDPGKIAIKYGDRSVSYEALERGSNKIANFLHREVKKSRNAIIILDRSVELVESIIAVLKCGLIFVPIDPVLPAGRVKKLLKETGAQWVITSKEYKEKFKETIEIEGQEVLSVDDIDIDKENDRLEFESVYNKYCYIYFTSGSTGIPKGVLGRHRSLVHFIEWEIKEFAVKENFHVSQFTSPSFDPFLRDIFVPLAAGATCCIVPKDILMAPGRLIKWIDENDITLIHIVPSLFKVLVNEIKNADCFKNLEYVLFAGELLRGNDIKKFTDLFGERIQLVNLYGPTETTLAKLFYRIKKSDAGKTVIPVGKTIDNAQAMVLDNNMKECLIRSVGEIYIRTPFISSGYFNDRELTKKVFLKNPYTDNPQDIIYKSGDLGRLLPDGNIEIVGRVDHQVKIRGIRIELGEIENQLLKHQPVKDTVVTAGKDGNGDYYLRAYVVLEKDTDISSLREYLSGNLPDYMIPSYFIPLEKIPLNPNGKVDRTRLPDSRALAARTEIDYLAPKTGIERRIAHIWREILKLEKVGVNHNFFDLGGNSLKMMEISSRLSKEFKKEIPVTKLFEHSTIGSLSKYLEKIAADENVPAGTAPGPGKTARNANAGGTVKEIAIIGMSCRFPGARDYEEFWDNLKQGTETISFFTEEELLDAGIKPEQLNNRDYVKAAGILPGKEFFDASFFSYSPREAELLNPQTRIFHECAWEALEDAGIDPRSCEAAVGVYAGASHNFDWDFQVLVSGKARELGEFASSKLTGIRYLCTQLSYNLNLRGPSVTIQTACSTSLVAIHMARGALSRGDCDIALAGGITLQTSGEKGYIYQEDMIFSRDGHTRPFDEKAQGTIFGEGGAVVVLKPLSRAEAEGDAIHAVIKSTAINNDGNRRAGFTAPSVLGQVEAIQAAHDFANIAPESITYIEAHGTGTILGDPIEIEALKQVFGTNKEKFCAIGSVKSNVGHLDCAAGIAGLIKTILALKHRLIPPSLNFEGLNPGIDLDNSPFYVNTRLKEWKCRGFPLRAGVSSFGFGGTNAHVILEGAPAETRDKEMNAETSREHQLILLSAKSETALDKMTKNLLEHFKKNPGINLADAAYTLQTGRHPFPYKKMCVCSDVNEAIAGLSNQPTGKVKTYFHGQESPPVIFMFPGQGAQYVDMGRDLYETEPVFREEIDRCFEILAGLPDYDIKEILYPSPAFNRSNRSDKSYIPDINRTEIAQPLLFVFEYALAKLLMKFGIRPDAMMGHSIGEYTAACLAGVFSREDALKLVVSRGKSMREMPTGSMLSVPLAEEELIPLLNEEISMAAVNSSARCVVSGPHPAIAALENQLSEKGYKTRRLHTSHAFHSKTMDPILEKFAADVGRVTLNGPGIPYISNLTGKWITAEEAADPTYWARHLRHTVRFGDGLNLFLKGENLILLEVGPGKNLTTFVKQHHDRKPEHIVINTVRHSRESVSDSDYLLDKIGQLWLYGKSPDWSGFYSHEKRHRLHLPGYPFEGRRYWPDVNLSLIRDALESRETRLRKNKETAPIPGIEIKDKPDNAVLLYRRPGLSARYAAPETRPQQILVNIWQGLFGIEQVGIHDDFFELGGDSIHALQVAARMREAGYQLKMDDLFANPTISGLTPVVTKLEKSTNQQNKKTKKEGELNPVRPGDLTYKKLSPGMFDRLKRKYDIGDVYTLSPMQEGILFHTLFDDSSLMYLEQMSYRLHGELDIEKIEKSLNQLFKRHEIFRTAFVYDEDFERPIQVVLKERPVEFYYEDLRKIKGKNEKEKLIAEFKEKDRGRKFDLSKDVLMRVTILRQENKEYEFTWTYHHILMDGWGAGTIIAEFLEIYTAYLQNREYRLPEAIPFRVYIQWLENRDKEEARAYWKKYLEGYDKTAAVSKMNEPGIADEICKNDRAVCRIDEEKTGRLNQLAVTGHVTLNTIIHAAWAILLGKYTGKNDVVFGVVVSGRPPEIVGIESMVGLFTNTVPVRIRYDDTTTFRDLIGKVQEESIKNRPFHYCQLAEIQAATPLNRNLFDHILEYGNYPVVEQIEDVLKNRAANDKGPLFEVSHVEARQQNNYNFDLIITAERRLTLTFRYNHNVYDSNLVQKIARRMEELFNQVLENPDIQLEEIIISHDMLAAKPNIDRDARGSFAFQIE